MSLPRAFLSRCCDSAFRIAPALVPFLGAMLLVSCLSSDNRIAGSSTEAGNAGGKVSLTDGRPAGNVPVVLVAKNYLPDTLGRSGSGDLAGSYYRTHTGPDGVFHFRDVAPGNYRVMAVDSTGGVTADSVSVRAGKEDTLIDEVMKPLGGISGIAKIVGSASTFDAHIWVRPKATLMLPPLADGTGAFRLDSLPEGEYELLPQCSGCQPVVKGVTVAVKAGLVTVLTDTLKLYPEYFFGFPDSGDLVLRSAWLPVPVGGKINRGAEDRKLPASVTWTWNGDPITGKDLAAPEGISETSVLVDSGWFPNSGSGKLRLALHYPDTSIIREWRVVLDPTDRIWPMSAVAASGAVRIPGPAGLSVWRMHVTDSRPLDAGAVAFWNLRPNAIPNTDSVPEWVDLGVDDADMLGLAGIDTLHFTFFLVPDRLTGGRMFRPRRDERLEDIAEIHYLDHAAFGFSDSLIPSFRPGGLIVDRRRGPRSIQRYRVAADGAVEELPGGLTSSPAAALLGAEAPILFYRSGPAAAGFAWDKPLRDAAKVLAVTRAGLAVRLDGAALSVQVTATELDSLTRLLEPLSHDPPALADTGLPALTGTLEYARAGKRGVLRASGGAGPADVLLAGIRAWMVRNGLDEEARFPLATGTWSWLGFAADSSGLRLTGDTLQVELADSAGGVIARESLSAGSPARLSDSVTVGYFLVVERDSLVAVSDAAASSRLFGRIDGSQGVFALTGLGPVTPQIVEGIPVLTGGGNTLAGRLTGDLVIQGRSVTHPALFLDGRAIATGRQGQGFLYTPTGGLERSWRFGGRSGSVTGWDRR